MRLMISLITVTKVSYDFIMVDDALTIKRLIGVINFKFQDRSMFNLKSCERLKAHPRNFIAGMTSVGSRPVGAQVPPPAPASVRSYHNIYII